MGLLYSIYMTFYFLFCGLLFYIIISHRIPKFILLRVEKIFGPKAATALQNSHDYVMNQSNPVFQILYLIICLGSWSIYIAYAFPLIIASKIIPTWHVGTGLLTFLLCLASFQKICHTSPGNITARSMPKFDNYEYDNVLFVNRICPTLNIRKLPRSKYCRVTKRHVPRFDHFCGWLNKPIGEENYRFFLFFIFVQTFMCIYGSYVSALIFWEQIVKDDLLNARFYNASTGVEVDAGFRVIFNYLYAKNRGVSGCFLLQVILGIAFLVFFIFHIMLVCRNMTTNEFSKWRSVRKWHLQAKKRYLAAVKEGRVGKDKVDGKGGFQAADALENVDVGCAGISMKSEEARDQYHPEDDESEEMDESVDPGPFPVNIYNLGIIENVKEVLFPRSQRKEALIRWATFVTENQKQKHSPSRGRKKFIKKNE